MVSYKIEWKRSATLELKKLPAAAIVKILSVVENLATNPFPPSAQKLAGAERTFRIRKGVYRILYTVSTKVLLIEVVKIGHRKDIYR